MCHFRDDSGVQVVVLIDEADHAHEEYGPLLCSEENQVFGVAWNDLQRTD